MRVEFCGECHDISHVIFRDASWEFYEALLVEHEGLRTRMNYDTGTLELMTAAIDHSGFKEAMGGKTELNEAQMLHVYREWLHSALAR